MAGYLKQRRSIGQRQNSRRRYRRLAAQDSLLLFGTEAGAESGKTGIRRVQADGILGGGQGQAFAVLPLHVENRAGRQVQYVAGDDVHHPAMGDHQHALAGMVAGNGGDGREHPVRKPFHGLALVEEAGRIALHDLLQKGRIQLGFRYALDDAEIPFLQAFVAQRRQPQQARDDLRRFQRAAQGARVDAGKAATGYRRREFMGLAAAEVVEQGIGPALQDAGNVPIRFAMAGNADVRGIIHARLLPTVCLAYPDLHPAVQADIAV